MDFKKNITSHQRLLLLTALNLLIFVHGASSASFPPAQSPSPRRLLPPSSTHSSPSSFVGLGCNFVKDVFRSTFNNFYVDNGSQLQNTEPSSAPTFSPTPSPPLANQQPQRRRPPYAKRDAFFPRDPGSSTTTTTAMTTTATTVQTSVPSPSSPLNARIPNIGPQAPKQAWCPSEIFCNGELLQTINIAQLYSDSKTFVDKPTRLPSNRTLDDFYGIVGVGPSPNPNVTYGELVNFVDADFVRFPVYPQLNSNTHPLHLRYERLHQGEGLELIPLSQQNTTPSFLSPLRIPDPLVLGWSGVVHSYWGALVRGTDPSKLCTGGAAGCESTLIPLNHTFVVPGGRFREQYYWDSYWIVEGLLQSEHYSIVNSTLQNFMDELEMIGFIPNGGRKYYLNRSQPPMFMKGFLQDYLAANGPDLVVPYNESQKADLYAELASGAESGHDYSSRWIQQPLLGNTTNTTPALRTLNVRKTIPVDLNSALYKYRLLLADLYDLRKNAAAADHQRACHHRHIASNLKQAILDLFWDPKKLAFYDFNMTSNARGTVFTPAAFWPFWNGIIPKEVLESEDKAKEAFGSVRLVLSRYNGTFPASFLVNGLQWDAPNAWPPHQFIIFEALKSLPKSITSKPLTPLSANVSSFSLIPKGQLGFTESELPLQPLDRGGYASGDINEVAVARGGGTNGTTVVNGGNATTKEDWASALSRELANRYISSVFCSWYSTGGSIPGLLDQLPPQELNATNSIGSMGHMFEKTSMFDIDVAGGGGEYTVQVGFGWTNGVALYFASKYGKIIDRPHCPAIRITPTNSTTSNLFSKPYAPFKGMRMVGDPLWRKH
ncbi:Six-hairpin glycosidase-like protein [Cantharellus anzutake]|uniref:Six-hairpin glycosidase-like protein n=1 Tax=Cantharellus anzutake TaxID=1750568 RepID=UPI001906B6CA|nr:Six-hairpin glycosidase-like protein [Cantharellus anzutake]KAF8334741.1 Six-hairpin glycosidase-like protein [Cantharellus anzutake]